MKKPFLLPFLALLLTGCAAPSEPSVSSSNPVDSSSSAPSFKPEQEYRFVTEDLTIRLGESAKVQGRLTPVDFAYSLQLEDLSQNGVVAISEDTVTATKEGESYLKATASSLDGAYFAFSTATVFRVQVIEAAELYSDCELLSLKVGEIDVPLGAKSFSLDYPTYLDLSDHQGDVTPYITAKASTYAKVTEARFVPNGSYGYLEIAVLAEDREHRSTYRYDVSSVYIPHWKDVALRNPDFEESSSLVGWDLENFANDHPTSSASSIDLTPIKSPATRVFSMYGNVVDEKQEASLSQKVYIDGVLPGDEIELSCLVSTSYGTRIKSIRMIGGQQKIEMDGMSTNWRAQIITQRFILSERDIEDGCVRVGLCFLAQDETSTSGGWMYLDDFALSYLEKVYPKE